MHRHFYLFFFYLILILLEYLLLDHNALTGSADAICSAADAMSLEFFVTDCAEYKTNGLQLGKEVNCECCQLCCHEKNVTCNQLDWNINLDPIWEYGYARVFFQYSQNEVEVEGGT